MYVTRMLRFGDPEKHSYIVGVYSSYEQARFAGEVERSWRGGKYEYEVSGHIVDQPVQQELWTHHMGVENDQTTTYC